MEQVILSIDANNEIDVLSGEVCGFGCAGDEGDWCGILCNE